MQRFLLLSIVAVLTFNANAQKDKLILGEWVYSEPIGKAEMDDKTVEMMDAFFSYTWFSFKPDGTYALAMAGSEETGTWKMNKEGTLITFTPKEGTGSELKVLDVTATTWLMEFEPGKGFKMVHGPRKTEE